MVAPFLLVIKIPLLEIFPRAVFLCFDRSNPLPVIRHPSRDGSGDIIAVGGEDVYVRAVNKPIVITNFHYIEAFFLYSRILLICVELTPTLEKETGDYRKG